MQMQLCSQLGQLIQGLMENIYFKDERQREGKKEKSKRNTLPAFSQSFQINQ